MPKTRVLLADDHTLVAEALKSLLAEPFDLVGVVHDGRALVEAAEKLRPDVIVTDISMPLLNGLEAVRQLRERQPETRIMVLTMHRDTHLAASAFRAGVSGYLLKISPSEELVKAIREVAQGRSYVTSLLAKDLINLLMDTAPRENEAPLTAGSAKCCNSSPRAAP
jgi:DNA-binding NarL/FixJ family response regulator